MSVMQERFIGLTPPPLPVVPRNRAQRRADAAKARKVNAWLRKAAAMQEAKLARAEAERKSALERIHRAPAELILEDDPAIRQVEAAAVEQIDETTARYTTTPAMHAGYAMPWADTATADPLRDIQTAYDRMTADREVKPFVPIDPPSSP